jgi:hypothetical protein
MEVTTPNDRVIVKEYLSGRNTYEIGRDLGISYETVRRILHRTGTPIRPRSFRNRVYKCDHKCFAKKTVDSMYYAGLLMADGNIRRDGMMLQIELKKADSYLLTGLKAFAKYDGPLEKRTRKQKSGHLTRMVGLRISSAEMVKDLRMFGVVPCKSCSGRISGWVGKHPYAEFFFRGLFDGDGCMGIRRGKYRTGRKYLTFGGSRWVVNSFRRWIAGKTGEYGGLSRRAKFFRVLNYSYLAVPKVGMCLYGNDKGMRLVRKSIIAQTKEGK